MDGSAKWTVGPFGKYCFDQSDSDNYTEPGPPKPSEQQSIPGESDPSATRLGRTSPRMPLGARADAKTGTITRAAMIFGACCSKLRTASMMLFMSSFCKRPNLLKSHQMRAPSGRMPLIHCRGSKRRQETHFHTLKP